MASRFDHPPTHRDLSSATLAWFLSLPWCTLGAYELDLAGGWKADPRHSGSGRADVLAISSPSLEHGNQVRLEQHQRAQRQHQAAVAQLPGFQPREQEGPRLHRPRIAVCEVKRTRSDLLADLRERKLLRYGEVATHLYLAATDEALGIKPGDRPTRERTDQVLRELAELGLPKSWGVLRLTVWERKAHRDLPDVPAPGWHVQVDPLRAPGRQLEDAPAAARAYWQERIARSLLYRTMGGSLPDHLVDSAA